MSATPTLCFHFIPLASHLSSLHPSPAVSHSGGAHRRRRHADRPPQCATPPADDSRRQQRNPRTAGNDRPNATPPPSIVFLLRHGMTDWNLAGRVQGSLNESRLNDVGIHQALVAGRALSTVPFQTVSSSPLHRARQTLRLIAQASTHLDVASLTPRVIDALEEMHFPWQGSLRSEIPTGKWAKQFATFKQNPRGYEFGGINALRDAECRAQSVWDSMAALPTGLHLLIAHNQTNKALISTAVGLKTDLETWYQYNCCLNVVVVPPDGRPPILRLCNSCLPMRSSMPRRSHRRSGYVRLLIYHRDRRQRDSDRIDDPLSGEFRMHAPSHVYTIRVRYNRIAGPRPPLQKSNVVLQSSYLHFPRNTDSDAAHYATALRFVAYTRSRFANDCVAIVAHTSKQVVAIFGAALRIGFAAMQRIHSDAGGLTIVDIPTRKSVAKATPVHSRVECLNVWPVVEGAGTGDGDGDEVDVEALLRYTTPIDTYSDC